MIVPTIAAFIIENSGSVNFYRAVLADVVCLSVRQIRLSQAGIVSKRLQIGSRKLRRKQHHTGTLVF